MNKVFFTALLSVLCYSLQAASEIRYGDLVHVTMKEDELVKFEGEVSTAGFVTLPYYGPAKIAGLTEAQAEAYLKKELQKELYQAANISVVVVKRAMGYVYVYGAVGNGSLESGPGRVEVPPEKGTIRALQAIAQVGGLSKWAAPSLAHVLVFDNKSSSYTKQSIMIEKAYESIGGELDLILKPEDIIVIPSLAEGTVAPGSIQVMVAGKVEKPGVVFFEPGEPPSLVRAILKAGNFNKFADKRKVRLIRLENGKSISKKVNIAELLEDGRLTNDIKLISGDLIVIDESWY
ncbi:MAG: polysaccharide biosynthesis/export family protein [Lentisphaeraceae bacterium]|nr:polysaccharide biosynthesis/export family protein [Lentisphaeraceae bacterium]